jgi:hypothetical protein
MITDSALIAFECLHAMRNGNSKCKEFGAYKLDLTKTYDRVDWGYLEGILRQVGFQCKWIQWIIEYVTTVRYSIRFSNTMLDSFKPSRGLQQGDPLSLYLFLFVADGLSRLLQHEVNSGALHELHICRRAPGISHLLFADDSLLFLKSTEDQANVINSVLRTYEQCTGQMINPSKCSMMFGTNVSAAAQGKIKEILKVGNIASEEKYLGLPTRGHEGEIHIAEGKVDEKMHKLGRKKHDPNICDGSVQTSYYLM